MQLPTPLSRRNPKLHKSDFGHALILAGSPQMLGAGALSSLAALRSGAGMITLGVPKSLVLTAQEKIANEIMVLGLNQSREQTFSYTGFPKLKAFCKNIQAAAIGPGITTNPSTQRFVYQCLTSLSLPLVIDADGLNALSKNIKILSKSPGPRILTPHPGEMARLTGLSAKNIETDRKNIALKFAREHRCVLLLKGPQTLVASPDGYIYKNTTGNVGMATAGSGDVLTGIITAFLAQGLSPFDAAKWGAYIHGKAGDLAIKHKAKASLIAGDIIDKIAKAMHN